MLVGRQAEQRTLDALLDSARADRSAVLVVRGSPGIGKTALLSYAEERAGDMRVLRCLGIGPSTSCPSRDCTSSSAPAWTSWSACPSRRRRRCAGRSA